MKKGTNIGICPPQNKTINSLSKGKTCTPIANTLVCDASFPIEKTELVFASQHPKNTLWVTA